MGFWGPFTAVTETLRPTVANADEQEWIEAQQLNRNPMPIDPLGENTFDASEYGLQTNDQTFTPDAGMTLQEMLAERELQEAAVPGLRQSDPDSLSFKYQPEFLRDYLGAGSPMLDYEGNERGFRFTDNYDPAFGALQSYISGDTGYPQENEPYRDEQFDKFEQIPSLQRRLGNPRFSLSEPQNLGFEEESETISTPVYQDRIRNRNLPGFAYEPQYRIRDQLKRDFLQGGLFRDAKQSLGQSKDALVEDFSGLQNIIGSGTKKGMDFMGGIKDYLMGGGMLGMGAKGIAGLLGGIFKESPEQKNFRENIASDPEYQDLVNSIPGMDQYNQIFGMGSGRGLTGAVGKRLAKINKALGKMTPQQLAQTSLKKRKAKLEALRELERQKESEFLESQRRGRRPGTGGGDGGVTADQGGTYGGYSYDEGGREGYGYGLKYGGRVGYANGGLASLFTRRG